MKKQTNIHSNVEQIIGTMNVLLTDGKRRICRSRPRAIIGFVYSRQRELQSRIQNMPICRMYMMPDTSNTSLTPLSVSKLLKVTRRLVEKSNGAFALKVSVKAVICRQRPQYQSHMPQPGVQRK
jgi:hypothetical protein